MSTNHFTEELLPSNKIYIVVDYVGFHIISVHRNEEDAKAARIKHQEAYHKAALVKEMELQ